MYEEAWYHLQALHQTLADFKPSRGETLNDQADRLYVLRKLRDLYEEARKAVQRKHDTCNAILVSQAVEAGEDKIKTEWCTVSIGIKMATEVPTPSKNPEAYKQFLTDICGVSDEEIIASGMLQIHFGHWGDYYTNVMLAAGRDLPGPLQGALKQYDASKTTIRKNKDLLEKENS